jgi:hypothetical protein
MCKTGGVRQDFGPGALITGTQGSRVDGRIHGAETNTVHRIRGPRPLVLTQAMHHPRAVGTLRLVRTFGVWTQFTV